MRWLGRCGGWFGLAAVLTTGVALGVVPSASAAPLKARFKPISSRAVTRTLSAARGGTLTLTAPGGVRIVVKIPPGALPADTKVTATPITRFRVAPVHGGFVAGVQLAPEGLQLLKPGSVEFRPRKGLRPRSRYFLGSQGSGGDVHLVPPAFRKVGRGRNAKLRVVSRAIVPILHFSTDEAFDWSKTNLGDVDAIRYPQSPLDQSAQDIAKLLTVERQKQLLGLRDDMDYSEVLKVMQRFRDHVLKPRLQVVTSALRSRCSLQAVQNANGALGLALGFVREEELLGLPVSFDKAELMGPILTGAANCMLQQCSRYGPRIAVFLFNTARQVELLAGEEASKAFFSALLANLVACSRGEVHLDSTINYDDEDPDSGDSTHYSMRVAARAPFEASPEGRWIYEEAPLEYQDVHGSSQLNAGGGGGSCGPYFYRDELSANSNGAFRINQLNFSQLDPTKPDTSAPIENLSLTITQEPTEYANVTYNCGGAYPGSHVTDWWFTFFGENHTCDPAVCLKPVDYHAPSFNGPDFVQETPPVIALATYTSQRNAGGYPNARVSENTLVEVISKPGPMEPLPNPI